MHDNSAQTLVRIARFARERLTAALYRDAIALTLTSWDVPGEPVPFEEAIRQEFQPITVGQTWGAPWGTTWIHATGQVPDEWSTDAKIELVVDLGFTDTLPGFQSEGLVYSVDGAILKAVEPRNRYVRLALAPGDIVDLYIEAAANPDTVGQFDFAPTPYGDLATAGPLPLYRLRQVDLAVLDEPVWELAQDVRTLTGLLVELPTGLPRRAEILQALVRCIEAVDPADVAGSAHLGRAQLRDTLAQPASPSAHRIHAVGHAHIDSAWLWPVRETVRKVARTFANVLALMAEEPDFVFAASSAQQYAWLKQYYPALFERVKRQVAAGRFVPVGGMWVESDTNMPGGEALARQFVAGKKFFMDEFGIEPLEVWLPDSFGYSAALPQIVVQAGSRWFLTQKLSWNDTNAFPHHSLFWEGIDGTRVFTHLPPVDTYSSELSGMELARAQTKYAEKGRANTSLVPFGWGDGGGGPTREMLAAAARTASLDGSPSVTLSSPRRFFEMAESEYLDAPVWSGELYLEFHRGTFTSQARTKRGNRRSEHLLREAELWATLAHVRHGDAYPYEDLEELWHIVLLQQFHDILPGTSIAWVHREAELHYSDVAVRLEALLTQSLQTLVHGAQTDATMQFNASPFPISGIEALGAGTLVDPSTQIGVVTVEQVGACIILANARVRVVIDESGLVSSIRDLLADREVVPVGTRANQLLLFRDIPNQWDAWDIDDHYRNNVQELDAVDVIDVIDVIDSDSSRATVRIARSFNRSTVTQHLSLAADSSSLDITTAVDWHETQKLLKVAFPLDVHADRTAAEIQFGHVYRPTHMNTSWDWARFETVAHRWVHVGEPGYGVSIANDSTYGFDSHRTTVPGGGTATTVRLSLLRAPLFPDPESDQGLHEFRFSVRVGSGIPEAVAEGYRLNLPLRSITGKQVGGEGVRAVDPIVRVDNPALVVEAVKLAEDRSGDVIVRLYEAFGTRVRAKISAGFPYSTIVATDLLERTLASAAVIRPEETRDRTVSVDVRPFQIITLRFSRD